MTGLVIAPSELANDKVSILIYEQGLTICDLQSIW